MIGGHYAFLTLERACNGKAMDGLNFLRDDVVDSEAVIDVQAILENERLEAEELGWLARPYGDGEL